MLASADFLEAMMSEKTVTTPPLPPIIMHVATILGSLTISP